jgi:hypothetical protein
LVSLYYVDQATQTYVPEIDEPSPYVQYSAWNEQSQQYVQYQPTPVQWTQYYEVPAVQLYTYEESTKTYQTESAPSPYSQYYYWSEPT